MPTVTFNPVVVYKLPGNVERMKHHTLTSSGNVWKQAMFNRIVFRAIRRIVRDVDFQAQVVGQSLQGFFENMAIGGIAATAITQNQ